MTIANRVAGISNVLIRASEIEDSLEKCIYYFELIE